MTSEKSYILIVDDEEIILRSLTDQLRHHFGSRFGYEVARRADEAWETIDDLDEAGWVFSAVISDWLMPGVKGDQFLIDVHDRFPDTCTYLLTGQATEEGIRRAREGADLDGCFPKPWNEKELMETMDLCLQ